ncbi:MAG: type III secretion system inner membrane ring subunit SctD [Desulfovibrionaceae bacterium]|nr:type III secretion system inner membrane ring subunit SctD [Desulfovibrionaceae bacterium]
MSSPNDCLWLHIFSGHHIGAELPLAEGQYVFGTDDSCDLIFSDSSLAGRHAALIIQQEEAGTLCSIQPLDGTLSLDGQVHTELFTLPQGTLCFVGLIAWAWMPSTSPSEAREAMWEELNTALQEKSPKKHDTTDAQQHAGKEQQEQNGEEENTAQPQTDLAAPADTATTLLELHSPSPTGAGTARSSSRNWVLFFFVLILVAAFSFRYEYRAQPSQLAVLTQALEQQKITGLRVQQTEAQEIQISGTVPDDATRAALLRFVRSLSFPVLLDITVANDSQEAILAAFTSRGFYPALSTQPPKKLSTAEAQHMPVLGSNTPWAAKPLDGVEMLVPPPSKAAPSPQTEQEGISIKGKPQDAEQAVPPQKVYYLSCYVKNPATEAWLFEQIQADIASISTASRQGRAPFVARIVHQEDVQAVLEPALRAAQLNSATVNYLAGSLDIIGTFDSRQREAIGAILASAEKELEMPLHTRHIGSAATAPASTLVPARGKEANPALAAAGATAEATGEFRVTGVTMTPIPFIQLSTGQRIFEGGSLPNGSVLEKIGIDILKLRRNGALSDYPLRGFHE